MNAVGVPLIQQGLLMERQLHLRALPVPLPFAARAQYYAWINTSLVKRAHVFAEDFLAHPASHCCVSTTSCCTRLL